MSNYPFFQSSMQLSAKLFTADRDLRRDTLLLILLGILVECVSLVLGHRLGRILFGTSEYHPLVPYDDPPKTAPANEKV